MSDRSTTGKMTSHRIWFPADLPQDVRKRAEEHIRRMWKNTTKECELWISGRDRQLGAGFGVRAYAVAPQIVPSLVERLMDLAMARNNKIHDVGLELHGRVVSAGERYQDDMQTVQKAYDEQQKILTERVKEDGRVSEALSKGAKDVYVYAQTNIVCELRSEQASKIVVEAIADYLELTMECLDLLVDELRRRGLAGGVVGYRLWRDLDRLVIDEIRVNDEDVLVWLLYPAKRVAHS